MNAPLSSLPSMPDAPAEPDIPSAAECARIAGAVIRNELEHRPYVALGAAVGVGFVVAGGLASPAAWSLARLGARLALALVTRKVGEALIAQASGAASEPAP